jgi:hypothetical protein
LQPWGLARSPEGGTKANGMSRQPGNAAGAAGPDVPRLSSGLDLSGSAFEGLDYSRRRIRCFGVTETVGEEEVGQFEP